MSRIAVIVATRGRPQQAGGVIECARSLLSGVHEVEFIVALDADDVRSIDYFGAFEGVTRFVQPRPIGVGDCWNRAARAHPADLYLALPDDAWIGTPWWDSLMADTLCTGLPGQMLPVQLGVVAWLEPIQPSIASIFGMTARWVEMNGFVFDPRFPFWFGDSALVETAIFATGSGMPGTDVLRFTTMPGKVNPRLRDMDLWWALFAATRHERVETGRRIAQASGLPEINDYAMGALIVQCEERDVEALRTIPDVLASIEHPLSPSPEYVAAKAAAEEYVARHREFAEAA